jgi:hypothetical protein
MVAPVLLSPSSGRSRPRSVRRLLPIGIGFLVIVAALAALFFWNESNLCHPAVPLIRVHWGTATPSSSPDRRSYYDNLTFAFESGTYTKGGCGISPPKAYTISTSNFIVDVAGASGGQLQRAGALCGPSANFSSCNATASGWYAALFSGSPGVLAAYPSSYGLWNWTGSVAPGTAVEHLSVVSSTDLNATGDTVMLSGVGYLANGYAYL